MRWLRVKAYLNLGWLDLVLFYTDYPNFSFSTSAESLGIAVGCAAQALYSQRLFYPSVHMLRLCRSYCPNDNSVSLYLGMAERRVQEQETGHFNFSLLQEEAKMLKPPKLDHASYYGPCEVRNSLSPRGRGLYVNKAVKAGDLLICEKAFGYAHERQDDQGLLVHPESNRVTIGAQTDLIESIIRKLLVDSYRGPDFIQLYRGSSEVHPWCPVAANPVVDT